MAEENNKLSEPDIRYETPKAQKKITFFNSFDEAEEHGLKQMARHSYEERLSNLEALRRRSFGQPLLTGGSRPIDKKKITVEFATYK